MYGVPVCKITETEMFLLGDAKVTVFSPVVEGTGEDNENGLLILAAVGEQELLMTEDADSTTERSFLKAYDLPDVDALVAGHHGSKYSTSNDLLDAVRPETVCISVGSNSYGHPADETVRRLAEHGCGVYCTNLHGMIHLTFN